MRMYWFGTALILSALLATLHLWAFEEFLYWRYVWFDILMHFLGGLALGVFLAAFLNAWRPMLFLVACTAILTGWELFEYLLGFPREANYVFDTALDLLMGTLGMLLAYGVARFTLWRSV